MACYILLAVEDIIRRKSRIGFRDEHKITFDNLY
jgi:hypothetical protein